MILYQVPRGEKGAALSSEASTAPATWWRPLLVCLAIAAAGAATVYWIFTSEPTAKREGARKKTAMLVQVTGVESGDFRPTIVAMGTVMPAREVVVRARVEGQVVEVGEAFVPGGSVAAGDRLVRLEPDDYETAVRQRRSELEEARAALKLEGGRQEVARGEFRRFEDTLRGADKDLVLRKPQLQAAEARVDFAAAALRRARLDLKRTRIDAPFDAQILERMVNIGSQVSPGDPVARLVGVNTYWVEVAVPVSKLRWLSFPGSPDAAGAEVRIRDRTAWPKGTSRAGHVYELVGELDDETRMARVLVTVDDPLSEEPPLMLGAFVEARIEGRPLEDVVRLDRSLLRSDDTVWVMKDGKLDIRDVKVRFRDEQHAYIESGLTAGDRVVTTNLATVVDGARLRLAQDG